MKQPNISDTNGIVYSGIVFIGNEKLNRPKQTNPVPKTVAGALYIFILIIIIYSFKDNLLQY